MLGATDDRLSVTEQQKVISHMRAIMSKQPLRKRVFFEQGSLICGAASTLVGLVVWRAAFRGFNLSRYGKARFASLSLSVMIPFNAAPVHSMLVSQSYTEKFRSENKWNYGINAALAYQLGTLVTVTSSFGFTFLLAHRYGTIPIPNNFLNKENGLYTLRYIGQRIRPYAKGITATFLMASVAMFFVGIRGYQETKEALAMMNRKTISMKEDNSLEM